MLISASLLLTFAPNSLAFNQCEFNSCVQTPRVLPSAIPSGYTGAAVVRGEGATVTAYRWTATGWVATNALVGSGYQVQPYAAGWSWAYRNGAWYAMRTTDLMPWSCAATPLVARRAPSGGAAYLYAAAGSGPFGVNIADSEIVAGETYYLICSNRFQDASGAPGYAYQLAWLWRHGAWTKAYVILNA
jgi:hypothetical protein